MLAFAAAIALLAPATVGLPTPAAAGFRHCVIIYDRPQRGPTELAPYVARSTGSSRRRRADWLFDAFLFCHFSTPAGIPTDGGATRLPDWRYQLDRWFAQDRDIAALDAAIESAARDVGPPPARRRVLLTIPYPNPSVQDFGDADGDGRSEDLATAAGRAAALRWYTGEAMRRFAAARYRHLELWGFYWMSEQVPPGSEGAVREAAGIIHGAGRRLAWIPWFRAPGWDRWRAMGFDIAFLQPNYAFQSWTHNGRVRRDRLAEAADLARQAGMGVEMEAGAIDSSSRDRQAFLHYLEDGATDRLGYQGTAAAWYLSDRLVEDCSGASDPAARALYDQMANYITGRRVCDPNPAALLSARRAGSRLELTAAFRSPRRIVELDVLLDSSTDAHRWAGMVAVEVRERPAGPWAPAGWALRPAPGRSGPGRGAVTIPVGRTALALRVTLTGAPGAPRLDPSRIRLSPMDDTDTLRHMARGARYSIEPAAQAPYPDTGNLLTDGDIPAAGWGRGRTVGWSGVGRRVWVTVDLGRNRPVDSVEISAVGGGSGGVSLPAHGMAVLGRGASPPPPGSGEGEPPVGLAWAAFGPPTITRRRASDDFDGVFTARFSPGTRTQYVTVVAQGGYWTMLSEIRVLARGANVAQGASYSLQPPPSAGSGETGGDDAMKYADDGARLTDGVVASGFSVQQLTGWADGGERTLTVDLGRAVRAHGATAWCLGGGSMGIFAPTSVEFETSADGSHWRTAPAARPALPAEDGAGLLPAPYRAPFTQGQLVRYVRARLRRAKGWTMLSEIEVR